MPPEDLGQRRLRLIDEVFHLSETQLAQIEQLLARWRTAAPVLPVAAKEPAPAPRGPTAHVDWPHAPPHRLSEFGTYFVTGATHYKEHFFQGAERLDLLQAALLSLAKETGWQLEAWAVFSNHYHFVAHALKGATNLGLVLQRLHGKTSNEVNLLDGCQNRRVWFNFWDTELTYEKSYLARLNYVHQNPVKHGLVRAARLYRWCSAGWFEQTAARAQVETIYRFKIDKVHVRDDYDPI